MTKIEMMDPKKLAVHPVADLVPMLPETHAEAVALRESIAQDGILQPLLTDPEGRVIDGRHRLRAARLLGLAEVPVTICPAQEAAMVALQTALSRRQFNEGQRAVMIAALFPKSVEERKNRKLANLKKGANPAETPEAETFGIGPDIKEIAATHGVSEDYLQMAYRVLGLAETKRQKLVERVMAGEVALWAAVAGLGGEAATKGQKKRPINYPKNILNGFTALKKFARGWERITEPRVRNGILKAARAVPSALPDELLRELEKGIKEARHGRR